MISSVPLGPAGFGAARRRLRLLGGGGRSGESSRTQSERGFKKKKRRGRGYRGIEIRIISERLVIIGRSLSALGVSGTPSCWKGSLPSVSSEPICFFFFHWKGHCVPASVRQIGVNQDLISFSFGGGV